MKHIVFITFFSVLYLKMNGILCGCIPGKDGEGNLTTVDKICQDDVREAAYDSNTEEQTLNVTGEHALNFTYPSDNSKKVGNSSSDNILAGNITSSYPAKRNKGDSVIEGNGFTYEPKRELPMAIIIAGPAAAAGIFLFLCVAYYFHNAQLNEKAKRLSYTLYISPEASTETTKCDTYTVAPTTPRTPQNLTPASRPKSPPLTPFGRQHSRDSSASIKSTNSQRRKSTLTVPSINVPGGSPMGKRGSNWSALADQEILILSAPRRHSTFII